jgi:hypothetical protein
VKLEKAFIKKFAADGLIDFETHVTGEKQPRSTNSYEWFKRKQKERDALEDWSSGAGVIVETFLKRVVRNFTCPRTLTFLAEYAGEADSSASSDSEMGFSKLTIRLVEKACRRGDALTQTLSKKDRSDEYVRVAEISHRPDTVDEFLMVRAIEECDPLEEACEEFWAEGRLYEHNHPLTSTLVARLVREERWRPRSLETVDERDIRDWRNVMGRKHEKAPLQICPFHACAPKGCKETDGRCKWVHKSRS